MLPGYHLTNSSKLIDKHANVTQNNVNVSFKANLIVFAISLVILGAIIVKVVDHATGGCLSKRLKRMISRRVTVPNGQSAVLCEKYGVEEKARRFLTGNMSLVSLERHLSEIYRSQGGDVIDEKRLLDAVDLARLVGSELDYPSCDAGRIKANDRRELMDTLCVALEHGVLANNNFSVELQQSIHDLLDSRQRGWRPLWEKYNQAAQYRHSDTCIFVENDAITWSDDVCSAQLACYIESLNPKNTLAT